MNKLRDNLLIAAVVIALLYVGKPILVPLLYSLLIAIVLYPMVARLERAGIPRPLAITVGLLGVAIVFCAIALLLLWQVNTFRHELPELRARSAVVSDLMEWMERNAQEIPGTGADHWEALLSGLPPGLAAFFVRALDAVFGMVFNLFIIPVFTALLLFDRRRYVRALTALAGPSFQDILPDILHRGVHGFARFIIGMVKVYAIVGVLNSIGLLLLGVENAILFGMLSAIMTIVPYIGIIISALLPMTMAWIATGNAWFPLGVVAMYAVVQYLEANLIFPKVVGSQLNLNTLASIVIVLAGALLWGVSGMILLLPFMAILKIVASEVPSLKPLDILLGDRDAPVIEPPPSR